MLGEAEGDLVEVLGANLGVLLARFLALLGFRHCGFDGGRQIAVVSAFGGGYAVAACVGGLELAGGLVEVHQMAVELGTVDAAELHLVADTYAAGAAHAGAVDHHAVEAHDGGQVVLFGGERDELHHRQRSDGHTVAVVDTALAELVDLGCYQPLLAVAAVVGHDVQVVAHGAQLVLVEEQVFGASADDDVGGDTLSEGPLHLWEHGSDAHAAGHEEQAFELALRVFLYQLARPPQRTHDGVEVVALVHRRQLACCLADNLEDDDHRLALVDDVADGQGYAFAVLVRDDDDELARLAAERYPRSVNLHPVNLMAVEQPLADNLVHKS